MQDPVSGVHVWITCWVARRGSVVCRPCVNEKNVLFCLQGISFMHFSSFFFFLCMFQCCALYPSGVIHPYFLQPYLLLCNQLFSRPQTFLSKDSNVCSVVMDMLGIQQWAQSLAARVGVVYTGAVSCSSNADFFFFFFAEVWTSCLITVHSSAEVLRSYTCLNTQGLKVGLFTDQRCWGLLAMYNLNNLLTYTQTQTEPEALCCCWDMVLGSI